MHADLHVIIVFKILLSFCNFQYYCIISASANALECYVCSSESDDGCDAPNFDHEDFANMTESNCTFCGVSNILEFIMEPRQTILAYYELTAGS